MKLSDLPQHGEFWKALPPRDQGDENPDAVYLEVGKALTTWEGVEMLFAMLFGIFVEATNPAAQRAYGLIVANAVRRQIISETAGVFFTIHKVAKSFIDELDILMNHYSLASNRRSEIAHGTVMTFSFADARNAGSFLIPPLYNAKKTTAFWTKTREEDKYFMMRSKYRYTSEDLRIFIVKFGALQQCIMDYTNRLSSAHPQPPQASFGSPFL